MSPDRPDQFQLSISELRQLANSIWSDYEEGRGPFEEYDLPEYDVIYELPEGRERANFITLVVAINLNVETSGGGGLWQTALKAYQSEKYSWIFSPEAVAEKTSLEVYQEAFKPLGWDDGKSHVFWTENATTIADQFDGDIRTLLREQSYDATKIQAHLQSESPDRYPSLKGDKVSALWLRLIDEEIHTLDSIAAIEIPADRNILRVTDFLRSEDLSERTDENLRTTRELWQEVCHTTELVPVHIDKPLWLCGKRSRFDHFDHWDNWGREYVSTVAAEVVSSS